jgi:hypothetical protein
MKWRCWKPCKARESGLGWCTPRWPPRRRSRSGRSSSPRPPPTLGNLRFYQRQGFRFRSVERDAFTPALGYPPDLVIDGIPLRDRIWLDRPTSLST